MKVVPQSVQLMALSFPVEFNDFNGDYEPNTQGTELQERLIETAGRVCYKSEDKITDISHIEFIEKLKKLGHKSVVEHASATFRIICDRGVSHEIVRHRIASYSQESTRYCNYSKDRLGGEITVIEPPGLTDIQKLSWTIAVKSAEREYLTMVEWGLAPQIARSVLPTCLKTEIVMTMNFRELKHFVRLRTSIAAHPQMREVALKVEDILKRVAPTIF